MGLGDAASGWLPDWIRLDVAITAPSVGLPTIQPGGLSPGHEPIGGIRYTTYPWPRTTAGSFAPPNPCRDAGAAPTPARLTPRHTKAAARAAALQSRLSL